jgi:pheromone shutdown protein TraB
LKDTESVPLLVEVGHASREVRGEHMVRTLVDLAARGERVFAVVGASHVIRQEPGLGKALEKALAKSAAGAGD